MPGAESRIYQRGIEKEGKGRREKEEETRSLGHRDEISRVFVLSGPAIFTVVKGRPRARADPARARRFTPRPVPFRDNPLAGGPEHGNGSPRERVLAYVVGARRREANRNKEQ